MTTGERISPEADPDLAHLIELLKILPGPTEQPQFWAAIQTEGRDHEPTSQNLRSVYEKLAYITLLIREPTSQRIVHLCNNLAWLFSGDRPDLWVALNHLYPDDTRWGDNDTGRWWAEDITRTAWRLKVRYQHYGDDSWKNRWHFDTAWTEWLTGRGEG